MTRVLRGPSTACLRLVVFTCLLLVAGWPGGVQPAQAQETWTTLPTIATSDNTGEKPQSKVWFHGHTWWTVLPTNAVAPTGTWLFRLEANNTWTPVLQVTSLKGRADTKAIGNVTHVLVAGSSSAQLVSLEYIPASNTYQPWSVRPVPTPVYVGETGTIAIDSTGKMWLATESATFVEVYHSDYPYTSFAGPIYLATDTDGGDINAVVALPNNTVGVFWSNFAQQRFGFRVHQDGADPNVWLADETPALAFHPNQQMADDHLNLAVASDGTLYAVVKAAHASSSVPLLYVLVRHPQAGGPGGTWDDLYGVSSNGTRPIVLLNEDNQTLRVFYSASGGIYMRESARWPISFGPAELFLSGTFNDPTSTKQIWAGHLVVLASGAGTSGVFITTVPGLVGAWKMDEGSGTQLKDSSGFGNHASVSGSPAWVPVANGFAMNFNGSTHGVVSDQINLNATTALSLSAWIKPNQLATQDVISRATFGSVDGYALSLLSNGKVSAHFNQASFGDVYRVDSTTSYPTSGNTWMHIAATYNGSTMRLYVNGVEEDSGPGPGAIAANALSVGIGGQANGSRRFRGDMDDVRIYNRVLTPAEVAALAGDGPVKADLMVTKTNSVSTVYSGLSTVIYNIQVTNLGPSNVAAVSVSDPVSNKLTGVTWTCTASSGSSCPASGTGSINHQISLEAGDSAFYTLQGTVAAGATGSLVNTVTVSAAGINDPVPGNNSATDVDTIEQAIAPTISVQPASTAVTPPNSATFSVTASGTSPLSYQWRRNGVNIAGAITSSYVFNPTATDNGVQYSVVVSNIAGNITSANATLTVNIPPSITTPPANVTAIAPNQASFSVVATGTAPLTYQWRRNGANISGATSASYSLNPTALTDSGAQFDVVVSNMAGSMTSAPATLTVLDGGGGGGAVAIDADFNGGTDGFAYADDLFRATTEPTYASGAHLAAGGFTSGGLQVLLGGINGSNIQKISGGWQRSFTLTSADIATLTFRYKLSAMNLKSERFGQMLVSLNGVLVGVPPNTYVAQVLGGSGGVSSTTQWQQVEIALGSLSAGTHVLALGGYLSGKSGSSEMVEVLIDDVVLHAGSPAPPAPPGITTQPASLTVTAPAAAAFSVVASGASPLSYQWRRNGVDIGGATSANYTLNPTAVSDNGAQFSVRITNSAGNVTSAAATLTVNPAPVPPSITTHPVSVTVTEPAGASFSVVAAGDAPLNYQWRRNGSNISGATSATYTLTPTAAATDNGATFDVVVSNAAGTITSTAALLTVSSGGGGTPGPIFDVHFTSNADGFTYQDDLFRNTNQPSYASGAYISSGGFTGGALRVTVGGVNNSTILNMSGGWRRSFTLAVPTPVVLSFRYRLTQTPNYEDNEFSQMLVSLNGVLHGLPPNDYIAQLVGEGPTTTNWQLVQLDLGTLAAGTHVLALGAYNNRKNASNESAEVLIDDVLLAPALPVAPSITTQPASITVTAPAAAQFSVVATGSAPLSYQWRRNGVTISGATNASYTLTPTTVDDAGQFDVVVSNGAGSVTSAAATLTVNPAPVPPSIITQPANVTVTAPEAAGFSVAATGDEPLSYQWRRNGVNIAGANAATYVRNPTSIADTGTIDVVVSNAAGTVTSAGALLTVLNGGGGEPNQLFQVNFTSGADGFTYEDDLFRGTNRPNYASGEHVTSGGFTGGALRVVIGGINSQNINDMSGGWRRSFTLGVPTSIKLSFRYRMTNTGEYENDEFNQMLVSVDGVLRGIAPNDYIAQLTGGGPTSTGWQLVEMDLGLLAAGTHVVALGGYNNQKTYPDEWFEILIDDVSVTDVTPPAPPSIVTQPASTAVTEPAAASFSVTASGSGPMTYQWRRNGVNVGGANGPTHVLNPTAMADNGAQFSVVITNAGGTVTSALATLTVNPAPVPPSILTEPASLTVTAPGAAGFSVVATGDAPLSYQWQRNGTNIAGATSATYTLDPTSVADTNAQFRVVVSNAAGTITSAAATLTVNPAPVPPSITTHPVDVTVLAPGAASFSVVATGDAPLAYQWRRNGIEIAGATSATYVLDPTSDADNGATFDVIVSNAHASVSSALATLTVNIAPGITAQPASATVTAPASATFTVAASGTGPLSYQWRRDGVIIGGATSATYVLTPTAGSDSGAKFDVVVSNAVGSVISDLATLTVNVPPGITTSPASMTVTAPSPATFTVVASGTAPLSYQWRRGGVDIPGATSATYVLNPTSVGDTSATFDVIVSNVAGSIISATATLTVNAAPVAPTITTQPANITVTAPAPASFSVAATGDSPLSYQWRRDGVEIAGATSSTYVLTPTAGTDNGATFDVVVTNAIGSTTSSIATLTVNVAPSITTPPAHVTVTAPNSATFTVVASGTGPLSYQWRRNGVDIAGATGASYVLDPTAGTDNGVAFDVVVSNGAGNTTSAAATLTVNVAPSITTHPASLTVVAPAQATFTVVASGTGPLSYQWRRNGVDIAGATSDTYVLNPTEGGDTNVTFDVVVSNAVGLAVSSGATLTVNLTPSITTDPASTTVTAPAAATFTVAASGTAPLSYQWRRNGVDIAGATSSSYTLDPTAGTDTGVAFDVVVSNSAGTVTSTPATLTVHVAASIATQPANVTVVAPASATFSVVASGTAPFSYQWRRNGVDIAGATSSSYVLNPTAGSDTGASFDVVVSNAGGSVTSAAATLTVNVPPAITTQPANLTVTSPDAATFTVVASGTALNYQWRRNGIEIAGATSASYVLDPTAPTDSGAQFSVVVSNTAGNVTSSSATLTVQSGGSATIVEAHFDGGDDNFVYADDLFRGTNQPTFANGTHVASGGFSGGGLQVLLGGVSSSNTPNMSGGWQGSFTVSNAGQATLSFRYKLSMINSRTDRYGDILASLDGILKGAGTNDYIVRLFGTGGGGTSTTGWQEVEISLGTLTAGNHVLALGGYLSRKSATTEIAEVFIDDVMLTVAQ